MNTNAHKTSGQIIFAGLALLALALPSHAALRGGDVDLTFDPGMTVNAPIFAVAVQTDGKVLIGGDFSAVNRALRNRIARLNADGTTDFTFMSGLSGVSGHVGSLAVQPDGKVLIAGVFDSVNGAVRNGIARLNSDGTLDTTFQNGMEGLYNSTRDFHGWGGIALQPDGKILIGGAFDSVNSVPRANLARLNPDGSLDATFQDVIVGTNYDTESAVGPMAVQPDGKILIGGGFHSINGVERTYVARLNSNGVLDASFHIPVGGVPWIDPTGQSRVTSLALQPDGKVLIAGDGIARLNADGTVDSSFNPTSQVVGNNLLALQPDGKVLIGGGNGVTRLNADGSLDAAFQDSGLGNVYSAVLQTNGQVLVGGDFDLVNGVARSKIARLNSDGSLDPSFDGGESGVSGGFNHPDGYGVVYSLVTQADGKVLVGGEFTAISGVTRNRIARLNPNGSVDSGFQNGMTGAGSTVNSVVLQVDGKLLIGGLFTLVNGVVRNRIARLQPDGSLDTTFQNGMAGISGASVNSLTLQPDGKIIVAGMFTAINGVARNNIARLNTDGSPDLTFQNGIAGLTNWSINAVALQSDGKVVIVGRIFLTSAFHTAIARLNSDGNLDGTFLNEMAGDYGYVNSVAVQSDGKVLIGGFFNSIHGISYQGVARLNSDGSVDTTYLASVPDYRGVFAIVPQSDGKALIGGQFGYVNSLVRHGIARLNADGSLDNSFQEGMLGVNSSSVYVSRTVYSIATQPGGKVLIGGDFTSVNGLALTAIARLYGTIPSLSNFGIVANQFAFTVTGEPNQVVVLEASTDLVNWSPLGTYTLGETAFHFTDPAWSGFLQRFYRARVP